MINDLSDIDEVDVTLLGNESRAQEQYVSPSIIDKKEIDINNKFFSKFNKLQNELTNYKQCLNTYRGRSYVNRDDIKLIVQQYPKIPKLSGYELYENQFTITPSQVGYSDILHNCSVIIKELEAEVIQLWETSKNTIIGSFQTTKEKAVDGRLDVIEKNIDLIKENDFDGLDLSDTVNHRYYNGEYFFDIFTATISDLNSVKNKIHFDEDKLDRDYIDDFCKGLKGIHGLTSCPYFMDHLYKVLSRDNSRLSIPVDWFNFKQIINYYTTDSRKAEFEFLKKECLDKDFSELDPVNNPEEVNKLWLSLLELDEIITCLDYLNVCVGECVCILTRSV